ncbi:MAG: hypothetical protein SWQ30_04925 [Thermodesulfobacteriota bacterium]|nr:hypothetical protein [Thermodesulfobacteriota bacterium]
MNAQAHHNRFFTVQTDPSRDEALRLIPSKYVDELPPQQAIAEMEGYIEALKDALKKSSRQTAGTPAEKGKLGSLAFEMELVGTFLSFFKKAFGTMH